ncbi:MAG: transposase, partial [Burkholderiales bacterium]|nr:transposase [Opitutaceae bacterium]
MKRQSTTKTAGVDVSKRRLDAALHGGADAIQVENAAEGHTVLAAWLEERGVRRVGMEASGGYERGLRLAMEAAGFAVVVHQPLEVRLFARLKRLRAKNDRLDARLIAAATAGVEGVRAAQDPLLAELAERLTAYEQIAEQAARLKACREHATLADIRAMLDAQIAGLTRLKRDLVRSLTDRIKAQDVLRDRWRLLQSLPGVGPLVAAVLVV